MSMIEKAARALCVVAGDDPDREGPWSEWWSESAYAADARAVIEALMEPNEAMVEAGADAPLTSFGNGQYGNPHPTDVWQAMLRAAINDG